MSTTSIPDNVMDYRPEVKDRVYYESILNGDVGYLYKAEGRTYVDRGKGQTQLLYRANEWKPVRELRPLTRFHAGKVAFEADKAMQFALGNVVASRQEWQNLTGTEGQAERMRWVNGVGPGKRAELPRKKLYVAIMACLEEMVE